MAREKEMKDRSPIIRLCHLRLLGYGRIIRSTVVEFMYVEIGSTSQNYNLFYLWLVLLTVNTLVVRDGLTSLFPDPAI